MLAHFLFALELSELQYWWALAAGIATAGLVLMVGRFLTNGRRARPGPPLGKPIMPQLGTRVGDPARQWRPAEPHSRNVPSDITYKVEETWK